MAREPSSRRYAQALFELASQHDKTEAWLEQLRQADSALSDPVISAYLQSPRVGLEQKMGVVRLLLEELDTLVVNTVGLLISRRAFSVLPSVVAAYSSLLNERLGRLQAIATSAVTLTGEQHARLGDLLRQVLGKEVLLELQEDSGLIGGVVVKMGDQVVDGSVRTRLQQLRRQLSERPVG